MSQILSRRAVVTAAPAAIVAASLPALAAGAHPDATLLALREPYERTLAEMDAASPAHSRAEEQYFALRAAHPELDERQLRKDSGLVAAERPYNRAIRRNDQVIVQIAASPAFTLAGVAFKARVSKHEENLALDLVESIVADLIALGGSNA